jgi:DegV family protein with EDD domain
MSEPVVNGFQIYHGFLSGYMSIARNRDYINRINVFPVPDADTGNNMTATLRAILSGLSSNRSPGILLENIADLSLEGARGNSGIILAQYLNSLAVSAGRHKNMTLANFGQAVKEAVGGAYKAMKDPREGTILTVLKAWAETIYAESQKRVSHTELFSRGLHAAKKALAETPEQLSVLKENNVVDAGAWGLVSFFEGFEHMEKTGPVPFALRRNLDPGDFSTRGLQSPQTHQMQDLTYRYCTEVLLDQCDTPAEIVGELIKGFGDSLIVSQGKNRIRIHIHTNNPAETVSLLRTRGRVIQQKADDMVRQEQTVNRKAGRIGVVTDSIADIPLEILDRWQIHVINQKLLWDEEEFLDRLTITPEEFYRLQEVKKSFPGSSVPERSRVDTTFRYLMDHYEGLIILPVARALSGTWQQLESAAAAYNTDGNKITVVDTCLNSAAQGLLVVEVAKAAASGQSLVELSALAENLKRRIRIFVSVKTFRFMVKGGRISPLKGLLATLLNLKPIVSLDEKGKGKAFDKAFSRRQLLAKMTRLIAGLNEKNGIARWAIVHAADPEAAGDLAKRIEAVTGSRPDYITTISPIVGMHSGRGAVALGLILKQA